MNSQEEVIAAFRAYLLQIFDQGSGSLDKARRDIPGGHTVSEPVFNEHLEALKAQVEAEIRRQLDAAASFADPEDLERELRGYARETILDFLCRNYDSGKAID